MLVPSTEMRAAGDKWIWKIMSHSTFLLFFALAPCTVWQSLVAAYAGTCLPFPKIQHGGTDALAERSPGRKVAMPLTSLPTRLCSLFLT